MAFPGRIDTEHLGQLADDDMDRDAGQKADRYGNGKQIGNPTGTEHPGNEENDADKQREDCGQRGIMRCAGCHQEGEGTGHNRRDRGIRGDRCKPVCAERRKGEGPCCEREQSNHRRQAHEPSGRQLPGHRDCGEDQRCDGVARQLRQAVAVQ